LDARDRQLSRTPRWPELIHPAKDPLGGSLDVDDLARTRLNQNRRIPRPAAGIQLGNLAENLPLYQSNIEAKMQAIKDANVGEGVFGRVSKLRRQLSTDRSQMISEVLDVMIVTNQLRPWRRA
jgi:hypothetical protein